MRPQHAVVKRLASRAKRLLLVVTRWENSHGEISKLELAKAARKRRQREK